ncbi:hypothetical protein [Ornithinicoccus halotolerans]|uniref:hypothetical protein n=1 Tax=Ornithinicoccus halotolerans TaxID=1748220 RepID=UPI001296FE31|nr:hypothetical protein [Ornithinicoccus halotolerans]
MTTPKPGPYTRDQVQRVLNRACDDVRDAINATEDQVDLINLLANVDRLLPGRRRRLGHRRHRGQLRRPAKQVLDWSRR